jgi:hypothetical protein
MIFHWQQIVIILLLGSKFGTGVMNSLNGKSPSGNKIAGITADFIWLGVWVWLLYSTGTFTECRI